MTKVYAKHEPYENGHLGEVTEEMKLAGPPIIRVVRFKGELYATEGSHRLAAAAYLGVVPKVWIEETEVDALPDEHWHKVSSSLPSYEFDHVLVLEPKHFVLNSGDVSDGPFEDRPRNIFRAGCSWCHMPDGRHDEGCPHDSSRTD